MKNLFYITLLSTLFLMSCKKTIFIDLPDGEPHFVIEAQFTNKADTIHNFVYLSKTSSLSSKGAIPKVNNALVYIEDKDGNQTVLTEEGNTGRYYNVGFIAQMGVLYKLHIESSGTTIESNYEQMVAVEPIDSIWSVKKEDVPGGDFLPDPENPSQDNYLLVNYHKDNNDKEFYKWILKTWKTDKYVDVFVEVEDDGSVLTGEITDRPMTWLSYAIGDTVEMEHYSLSRDVHDFWIQFWEQANIEGNPFDSPPGPVTSNLRNINNRKEQILGYFAISQVHTKRIIVE